MDSTDDVLLRGTIPKIADHDGIFASFNIQLTKPKPTTKTVFDYKNCDMDGLIKYIQTYDFKSLVFNEPTKDQPEKFTDMLTEAFSKFVPSKTITLHLQDQPCSNSYTRLLLRKRNRNYQIYKK